MKGERNTIRRELSLAMLAVLRLARLNVRGFVQRTYKADYAIERLVKIRRELEAMAAHCLDQEKKSKIT